MTPNLVLEKLAIDHANHVSDPEWECWHKRQGSFKSGYTRAISDVVEYLKDTAYGKYYVDELEIKFLKGENEKRVVTDTERLDWLLKNDATVIVGNSRQAIDLMMKGEK